MADDKNPPAKPPKGVETKPDVPAEKLKPAPAGPHMANDNYLGGDKKGKTRLDEKSK